MTLRPPRRDRKTMNSFSHHQRSQRAFSLIELLVLIALLAVVALISLPVYQKLRRSAKAIQCLNQTRQFGTAVLAYSAEHSGFPWWNGEGAASQTGGSSSPRFELWARPYLGYTKIAGRLRCPLMRPEDVAKNRFNYAGNGALCHFYPKLTGIPVPSSQVVLVAENTYYEAFWVATHLNMTMWGFGEREAEEGIGGDEGLQETEIAQNHGSMKTKGLHLFFLDGHVSFISPTSNDWRREPTYGTKTNGGYFYTIRQFRELQQNP